MNINLEWSLRIDGLRNIIILFLQHPVQEHVLCDKSQTVANYRSKKSFSVIRLQLCCLSVNMRVQCLWKVIRYCLPGTGFLISYLLNMRICKCRPGMKS